MNLAESYLKKVCPDPTYGPRLDQVDDAGLLNPAAFLLRTLREQGRDFTAPGNTVVAAARELETQQLAGLRSWRDQLARELKDESLLEVEIVFVELSSPQAVTAYEQDDSFAVGMDRTLLTFLISISAWAYFAAGLKNRGVNPLDAQSELLHALSDHVQLVYLKRALPDSFEQRELALLRQLDEMDWRMVSAASQLAAKFVLYHELAHVHLRHFLTKEASRLSNADSELISAFHEQELEFEADRFANEHLIDPKGDTTTAVVAKVAPVIYFYVLALKEAMAPTPVSASETMFRVHPPSPQRAERLSKGKMPPAYLPQWEIMFGVPVMLKSILESESFQMAAHFFRERSSRSA